jgi:hypothetical protein
MMLELIFTLIILFAFFAMCLWFGKAVWNSGEALSLVADDQMRESRMTEQPTQEWRIEAQKTGLGSTVYLNGEMFNHVCNAILQVGMGARTTLTLELAPRHVEVVADPELHLIVGDRRFRVIEETETGDADDEPFGERRRNGAAHQGL